MTSFKRTFLHSSILIPPMFCWITFTIRSKGGKGWIQQISEPLHQHTNSAQRNSNHLSRSVWQVVHDFGVEVGGWKKKKSTHSSFKCIAFSKSTLLQNRAAVFFWGEASQRANEKCRSVQMSACLCGSVGAKPTWMVTRCYWAGKQRLRHGTPSKRTRIHTVDSQHSVILQIFMYMYKKWMRVNQQQRGVRLLESTGMFHNMHVLYFVLRVSPYKRVVIHVLSILSSVTFQELIINKCSQKLSCSSNQQTWQSRFYK